MGMARNCENCTEECSQAERAHQAALGRMYSTREFITLLKKVESGELVEVVRCRDCKHWRWSENNLFGEDYGTCVECLMDTRKDHFCSYGERKEA